MLGYLPWGALWGLTLCRAGQPQWVDGIVAQGRKDAAQWLTLYDIYTSNDQNTWSKVSSGENPQVTRPCGNLGIVSK